MLSEEYNPANAVYYTTINGTENITTFMLAPMLATKGHFYQIADNLGDTVPVIRDHSGNVMTPDPDRDDTFLMVE